MARIILLAMKLALSALVIWKTSSFVWVWYQFLSPDYPVFITVSSVGLLILSPCLFLVGLVFLNLQNLKRVLVNWMIIAFMTFLGILLGDPITQGSYDHLGGLETWRGCTSGGIAGAALAYAIVYMRSLSADPDKAQPRELSQVESASREARTD